MKTIRISTLCNSAENLCSAGVVSFGSREIRHKSTNSIAALPLAAILLVASSAFPPSSRAEDAPKVITLTLTPPEVSYIWSVLAKQPYQEVAVLLQKMQGQVQAEAAKKAATPPAKK